MRSGHTGLWGVLAVSGAILAAGLVWRHADSGMDACGAFDAGVHGTKTAPRGGPGDRLAAPDAGGAGAGAACPGAELKGLARPDLMDPVVLRRELTSRLTASKIDWKQVADLLSNLDGPVDASVRGRLLQELCAGRRNDAMVAFEALRDGSFVADLFALLDDAEAPRGASRAALKALARMPGADPEEVARRLGARLGSGTELAGDLLRAIAVRGGAEAARVLVDHVVCAESPEQIPKHLLGMLELEDDAPAADVLLEAIGREQQPEVLRTLLGMVSKPGANRFTQALIDMDRGEESVEMRSQLLASLGVIGGERAVVHLLEAVEEGGKVGAGAVRALGHVRAADARACDRLLMALGRADGGADNEALRHSLVGTLGALGHEPALPRLVELLNDRGPRVRAACVRALGCMGKAARGQVGALMRLYSEDDPALHLNLAVAFGRIGGPEALEAMRTMSAAEDLSPRLRTVLRGGIDAACASRSGLGPR